MIIIGEKINGTLKQTRDAVLNRDEFYIREIARNQAEAGSDYLDVNAGTAASREVEDLIWLLDIIQDEVSIPLCLDSSNPQSLKEALPFLKQPGMINSISLEKDKPEELIPLIKKYEAKVIALTLDNKGIPKNVERRLEIAREMIRLMLDKGIRIEDIFIDPLLVALSTDNSAGVTFIETVGSLKKEYPTVNIVSGLSNISFGLPVRKLVNKTFLTLAIAAGMNAAILNPLDNSLMSVVHSTKALLGKDRYCSGYLKEFRKGRISE